MNEKPAQRWRIAYATVIYVALCPIVGLAIARWVIMVQYAQ